MQPTCVSIAVYSDVLPFLACPACRAACPLETPSIDDVGELVGGVLRCLGCGATYPIRDGVADFLGPPRPPTIAQVINELPPAAWGYERLWRPFALTLLSGEPFPYSRELPLVLDLMAPIGDGLYVDVACSNGLYARSLARALGSREGHVVGIDHSLPMLRQARRYTLDAGLKISYLRARAQALPIAPARATGVVVGGSLNEIGDLDACLSEIRRVLRADGRYAAMSLVSARTGAGRLVQTLLVPGGVRFSSGDELVTRFAAHGLRALIRQQYGIVLFTLCEPA